MAWERQSGTADLSGTGVNETQWQSEWTNHTLQKLRFSMVLLSLKSALRFCLLSCTHVAQQERGRRCPDKEHQVQQSEKIHRQYESEKLARKIAKSMERISHSGDARWVPPVPFSLCGVITIALSLICRLHCYSISFLC